MSHALELTPAQEDYLEIILDLARTHRVARVRDIARGKGVRMATVSDALRRLATSGLVEYHAREFVQLTPEGEARAQRVAGRHEFLRRFLTEILLLDPEVAERDACAVEHHLSPATVDRLASFYQFVRSCPGARSGFLVEFERCLSQSPAAGVKEPTADPCRCEVCHDTGNGSLPHRPLSSLRAGEAGIVHRVLAAAAVRRRLLEMGLLPGTRVELEGLAPLGDPLRIKVRGYRLSLRREEADAILVGPETP